MEKGDVFTYRKREYVVLSVFNTCIDGKFTLEYVAKEKDDTFFHRFYVDEKGKFKRII